MYVIYKKISRITSGKGPSDDIRTRNSVSLNIGGHEVVNQILRLWRSTTLLYNGTNGKICYIIDLNQR